MNPLTERVECAYCSAIPLRTDSTLLVQQGPWKLSLCPACTEIALPLWQAPPDELPPAIRNRLSPGQKL